MDRRPTEALKLNENFVPSQSRWRCRVIVPSEGIPGLGHKPVPEKPVSERALVLHHLQVKNKIRLDSLASMVG